MRIALVMIVAMLCAHCHAQEQGSYWHAERFTVAGYLATQAWDAAITARGFSQCGKFGELNPIMPKGTAGQVAYFAGTASGIVLASWMLHRSGHVRCAAWLLRMAALGESTSASMTTVDSAKC